jgi:hypothetical protein
MKASKNRSESASANTEQKVVRGSRFVAVISRSAERIKQRGKMRK